jgi:hypothetical protein
MRGTWWLLGTLAGCGNPSAEACERFVAAFEALPCAEGVDLGLDCRVYDGYPCDQSAYFECALAAQRCEEEIPVDGLSSCVAEAGCF